VISLENGSPAERAELREGDVIFALDDNPVCSVDDLHRLLTGARIGAKCKIELLRDSRKTILSVLAQEAPI
jgi:S1-C subfamily serine protease